MKFICSCCGNPTDNEETCTSSSGKQLISYACDECKERIRREIRWRYTGITHNEDTVICPYCGYEYEDDDAYACDEGEHEEIECRCCGNRFDLKVEVVRYFSTKRSICEMPKDYGEVNP